MTLPDPYIADAWLKRQKQQEKTRAQLRLIKDAFWDFIDRWKQGERCCPEFEEEIKKLLDDDRY